jgi:hypothetical protein
MSTGLRERIAWNLGWSVRETEGFSLLCLRDLVTDGKLKNEITKVVERGGLRPTAFTSIFSELKTAGMLLEMP